MRLRTRKLDESHLTEQERKDAVKYGFVSALMISSGITLGFQYHFFLVEVVGVSGGLMIISFLIGALGALEDERSRGA